MTDYLRLAKDGRPKLTVEGLRVPERCQCGNPIALSDPARAHALCVFCWPKERALTKKAIERAAKQLRKLARGKPDAAS